MTSNQMSVIVKVARGTLLGQPYRAKSNGERVTLASLYRNGLLTRKAWRGNDGDADAAYEYELEETVLNTWREAVKS